MSGPRTTPPGPRPARAGTPDAGGPRPAPAARPGAGPRAGAAESWIPVSEDSDFPIDNLPYGVFSTPGTGRRVGVAIGRWVLDLGAVLDDPDFRTPSLNAHLSRGPERWAQVRARLVELLTDERRRPLVEPYLVPLDRVTLHLPFEVADYVDFYASEHHAANLGRMLRPGQDPLPPNWRHLPLGYHGRAGTVVVSGTPVIRPCGQRMEHGAPGPVDGPSRRLDVEVELGFVVGVPTAPGESVPTSRFDRHVFGVVLLNDWSARDLQAWEYVPLGPFLGKSFATSISPWVVPMAALGAARVPGPPQSPEPVGYLREEPHWSLDITFELELNGEVVSRPPFARMYWSPAQLLAHLTANGATLRTGDLYGSGTVSGPNPGEAGSLIELTWGGTRPLRLRDGTSRAFLEDGDVVTIRASAPSASGGRIGFGELTGTVLPAVSRPER